MQYNYDDILKAIAQHLLEQGKHIIETRYVGEFTVRTKHNRSAICWIPLTDHKLHIVITGSPSQTVKLTLEDPTLIQQLETYIETN